MDVNIKRIAVVLGAIFGGILVIVVALWGLMQWQLESERQEFAQQEFAEVVVAAEDLEQGTPFTHESYKIHDLPEDFLPIGVMLAPDVEIFLNMPVQRDIEEGEPLSQNDFSIDGL